MKCPNCEANLPDTNLKFCEFCGAELSFVKESNYPDPQKILKSSKRRKRCC
ncbi:MAG: hypothetical protein P8Y70_17475 [Candidatus Lokiarchaeota archaeon]